MLRAPRISQLWRHIVVLIGKQHGGWIHWVLELNERNFLSLEVICAALALVGVWSCLTLVAKWPPISFCGTHWHGFTSDDEIGSRTLGKSLRQIRTCLDDHLNSRFRSHPKFAYFARASRVAQTLQSIGMIIFVQTSSPKLLLPQGRNQASAAWVWWSVSEVHQSEKWGKFPEGRRSKWFWHFEAYAEYLWWWTLVSVRVVLSSYRSIIVPVSLRQRSKLFWCIVHSFSLLLSLFLFYCLAHSQPHVQLNLLTSCLLAGVISLFCVNVLQAMTFPDLTRF